MCRNIDEHATSASSHCLLQPFWYFSRKLRENGQNGGHFEF